MKINTQQDKIIDGSNSLEARSTWRFVIIIDGLRNGALSSELKKYQKQQYRHWLSGHRLVEIALLNVPEEMCAEVSASIAAELQPQGFYAHGICGDSMLVIFPCRVKTLRQNDEESANDLRQIGASFSIPERQMPFESLFHADHPHGHEDVPDCQRTSLFVANSNGDLSKLTLPADICLCGRVIGKKEEFMLDILVDGFCIPLRLPGGPYPQIGDLIGIQGVVEASTGAERAVTVKRWSVFTVCGMPKAWEGISNPREILLACDNKLRQALKSRSKVLKILRSELDQRGFLEVETNILLPVRDIAPVKHFTVISRFADKDSEQVLRICPENQLKRMIVAGFDRVYEIGRSFRDERATERHLPEFSSMECYAAWAGYREMMVLCEELVSEVLVQIGISKEKTAALKKPWKQITFREAALKFAGIDPDALQDEASLTSALKKAGIPIDNCRHRRQLLDRLATVAIEPHLIEPTFLVDHPMETICVAKRHDDRPHLLERFEAYFMGIEIAHGFSELTVPQEQRLRMELLLAEKIADGEEEHPLDEEFIQALELGLPPTGGLGIGIDRLVMLATEEPINRTVPFVK